MNAQLLLLLALTGPFCAFTHASPTAIPEEPNTTAPGQVEDVTTINGSSPTVSDVAPAAVTTEALHEKVTLPIIVSTEESVFKTEVVTAAAKATEPFSYNEKTEAEEETVTTEVQTEIMATVKFQPEIMATAEVQTEATVAAEVQTEATAAAEVQTEAAAAAEVQTEAAAAAEVQTEATAAAEVQTDATAAWVQPKEEMGEDVMIEDGTDGGLSSGQVVGIVIGALLAVVIVIAVVIAVVRRMGKYSP